MALVVADRLVRPVGELVQAADRVAGGDLTARLPSSTDAELAPRERAEVEQFQASGQYRFGDYSKLDFGLASPTGALFDLATAIERNAIASGAQVHWASIFSHSALPSSISNPSSWPAAGSRRGSGSRCCSVRPTATRSRTR